MKKVYAINGSPRKNKNTAALLDKVLEGAKDAHSPGTVGTERVNLYDLQYTGCKSCFACKLKNGPSYGKCALKDGLSPVLEKLADADAVILGSPIYYRTITGQLHAFYERFFFPYMTYKTGYPTLVTNKMKTACIYTMNVMEEEMLADGYRENIKLFEVFLEKYFTKPQVLFSFNTYQFNDYSKYVCETFSSEEKAAYKAEHFPKDCEKAYELGLHLLD
ncbi:MAG: flavodoxin family protein [Akkermansia sp.]|nr:flavodoxin family protein [Akkermansia sp.]MCD8071370.1 flavodoxin family protein [Akkermansiaceae bacterium]